LDIDGRRMTGCTRLTSVQMMAPKAPLSSLCNRLGIAIFRTGV
jgi:hypothetical protein